MEAVQGVTACLLNGNVDLEALSRAQPKPSRPTHSRQGSRAGLLPCAVLFCAALCCFAPCCAVPCYAVSCCAMLWSTDLFHCRLKWPSKMWHAIPCFAMLCCTVLPCPPWCCAVLWMLHRVAFSQVKLFLQGVPSVPKVCRCRLTTRHSFLT